MEASGLSEVFARQLRHWRSERNLSAQGLADRLAEIGSELTRRSISKIENGDRGVSLDEWLQLAHALAVPPPLLFLDFQAGGPVAIAPNVALHPWIVWEWIGGDHASPVPGPNGQAVVSRVEEFGRAKTAIYLYKHQGKAASAVHAARSAIRAAEYVADDEQLRAARAQFADALGELTKILDEMIEHDIAPPGKPAEWIETIRSLGLSKYPDRLVIFDRPDVDDDGER